MATSDLQDWIDEHSIAPSLWFAKRLSANDTGLTGSHQGGPLIAKDVLFEAFPNLNDKNISVPEWEIDFYTDSHSRHDRARAVWYWSKTEGRITRVGAQHSPFLDPDNTGELAVFVFKLVENSNCITCHSWVCGNEGIDADILEELIGPVEPKSFVIWRPGRTGPQGQLFDTAQDCSLALDQIPHAWLQKFPSGEEIIQKAFALRRQFNSTVDDRLVKRRKCEFEIFQSIEKAFWLPKISAKIETLDAFLGLAQSILQSRKSRAGNSLELHTRQILLEENFVVGRDFQHRPTTENGKRPDFIFPSQAAYDDPSFPADKLLMLAVKTTCKDIIHIKH